MSKFTSEDLMKAMGLQVGDRVKCYDYIWVLRETTRSEKYLFTDIDDVDCKGCVLTLTNLIDQDFEILPRPKRVGDLKCDDVSFENCNKCPIKSICGICDLGSRNTLYEFLEDYKNHHKESFDQEIYDLLKARLDKVVE